MADPKEILEKYKYNLLNYKLSGRSEYKQGVTTYKTWLDTYIQSLSDTITKNDSIISTMVNEYRNANPEIVKMQETVKDIRKQGPELEDEISAIHERNTSETEIDWTPFYSKLVVIGALIGVAAVVTSLR